MKVRVTEPLHIRRSNSSVGDSYGILGQGFEFNVEAIVDGENYKNIPKWCRDKNGFCYWAGGVVELNSNGKRWIGTGTGRRVEIFGNCVTKMFIGTDWRGN
jgi:hypothetical protein